MDKTNKEDQLKSVDDAETEEKSTEKAAAESVEKKVEEDEKVPEEKTDISTEKGEVTAADSEAPSESVDIIVVSDANKTKAQTVNDVAVDETEAPVAKRSKSNVDKQDANNGSTSKGSVKIKSNEENLEKRKFKRIPVFVVDYHNDVLEFIYRCLATRHLPMENNILVHFDSHPDMVISREIPASSSFDKETMLAELSIENWIMPACYAGHFNRVVWLKNSWCQQMPEGKFDFKVGHINDKICVDCSLDYFISEGNYCETSELQQARDMQLLVYNVDTAAASNKGVNPEEFLSKSDADSFVLDIDLDFFSTSNPFLEIYKDANCYEQLTHIFHFETANQDCVGTTERRKQQLEGLKRIFEHLEEVRSFEGLAEPDPAIISAETYAKIENLAESLQKHYADDEIDWLLIYDSGSTTDTNGLPHHISNEKELEQYFAYFKQFLEKLPVPPIAITMACSAEDDYCPKTQVSHIQEKVLRVLRDVFGERIHERPILHYLDEEWDVMVL